MGLFNGNESEWYWNRLLAIILLTAFLVIWGRTHRPQQVARKVTNVSLNNKSASASAYNVVSSLGKRTDSDYTRHQIVSAHIVAGQGGIPVLMYHHVADLPANSDALRRDLTVSAQNFSTQLDYLQQQGYHTIDAHQLYKFLIKTGTTLPDKPILLTFDDGYDDLFNYAVPILSAHHMIGTFGIITGYVGTPGYAGWDKIKNAKDLGMEIISHTYSHYDFTGYSASDAQRQYEIVKAQQDLQEHLGFLDNIFIYPYGHYDASTEAELKAHGYIMAFTTRFGFVSRTGADAQNLLELPRVRVHGQEDLIRFKQSLGISVGPN